MTQPLKWRIGNISSFCGNYQQSSFYWTSIYLYPCNRPERETAGNQQICLEYFTSGSLNWSCLHFFLEFFSGILVQLILLGSLVTVIFVVFLQFFPILHEFFICTIYLLYGFWFVSLEETKLMRSFTLCQEGHRHSCLKEYPKAVL